MSTLYVGLQPNFSLGSFTTENLATLSQPIHVLTFSTSLLVFLGYIIHCSSKDLKFKLTADFILLPIEAINPLAPPLLTLVDISYFAVLQNFLNKKYITIYFLSPRS